MEKQAGVNDMAVTVFIGSVMVVISGCELITKYKSSIKCMHSKEFVAQIHSGGRLHTRSSIRVKY